MKWIDITKQEPTIGQVVLARISINEPAWMSRVTPPDAESESSDAAEIGFVAVQFKLVLMQWQGDKSILNATHWLPIPALRPNEDELDRYSALLKERDQKLYDHCQQLADALARAFPRFSWLVVPSSASFPREAFTVRATIEVNGVDMKAMTDVHRHIIESKSIDWVDRVGKEFAYNIAKRILTPEGDPCAC